MQMRIRIKVYKTNFCIVFLHAVRYIELQKTERRIKEFNAIYTEREMYIGSLLPIGIKCQCATEWSLQSTYTKNKA